MSATHKHILYRFNSISNFRQHSIFHKTHSNSKPRKMVLRKKTSKRKPGKRTYANTWTPTTTGVRKQSFHHSKVIFAVAFNAFPFKPMNYFLYLFEHFLWTSVPFFLSSYNHSAGVRFCESVELIEKIHLYQSCGFNLFSWNQNQNSFPWISLTKQHQYKMCGG